REEPVVPLSDSSTWVSPGDFGAIAGDGIDDTAAIQAAIDSGTDTIYIPAGNWTMDGVVEVRGNVQRIIGTEGTIEGSDFGIRGRFIFGETGPDTVVVERLANFGFGGRSPIFEHASDRTLVFRDVTGLNYEPGVSNPGDVFLNDTVGDSLRFQGGQNMWARQLNLEEFTDGRPNSSGLDAKIVNDGANVWVLGLKTEQNGVHVRTINGGKTELMGVMHLNQFGSTTPQFITEDASLSVAVNIKPYPEAGNTFGTFEETRNGETRTGRVTGTGYVAFSDELLWQDKSEIILDTDDPGVNYTGDWNNSTGFPGGWIGEDFKFASGGGDASVNFQPVDVEAGTYKVEVRWIADWGGQDHSQHATNATFVVHAAGGDVPITVNQKITSDGWFDLGTYRFDDAAPGGWVSLSAAGANGKINVDAARFTKTAKASTPIDAGTSGQARPTPRSEITALPVNGFALFAGDNEDDRGDRMSIVTASDAASSNSV
ncbi:MAG: hypothetical protein AAGK78_06580, partial [Planctomycetota bacterium]